MQARFHAPLHSLSWCFLRQNLLCRRQFLDCASYPFVVVGFGGQPRRPLAFLRKGVRSRLVLGMGGVVLAPNSKAGSSASSLGEVGGGAGVYGWKRTLAGLREASVGRLFLLPLVVPLGSAQLLVQDHGLAWDRGPWRPWLVHSYKVQPLVQRNPALTNYQLSIFFQVEAVR